MAATGTFRSKGAVVLAIANQKGGVGKTTTAVSLSAALSKMGYRVLAIDLDPHACLSVHLRHYPDELSSSINNIFERDIDDFGQVWAKVIRQQSSCNFDVAPASIRLSELEIDLRTRKGKGAILKEALGSLRQEYDYIVMDCPPHVGILLVNALVACDLLIVPIQTDFLALHGLKLLFDTIKVLNKVLANPIQYRVLPTLFDKRAKACSRVLELLTEKMPGSMFTTIIGIDTRFRDASAQGRVIYEIAPLSRGAQEYELLAKEITTL